MLDTGTLELDLGLVKDGSTVLDTVISLSSTELEGEFDIVSVGPSARLELELLLRGEVLVCRGLLEGSVVLRCARCLDHYGARVSESFTRSFTWGPRADEDDYETQSVLSRCSTVSILDGVREAIILSVPRMPLCSPDCRGLCPACGANLNRESCAHSKNGGSAAARN